MTWLTEIWQRLRGEVTAKSLTSLAPSVFASSAPNAAEYVSKYLSLVIDPGRESEVLRLVTSIRAGQSTYEQVSARTGVPWQVVGIIHNMECGLSFKRHLHNGDPLTARTRQVPAGRPTKGYPPFDFVDSAVDALEYDGFHLWRDWSVPGSLYMLERYNGMGYRKRKTDNPYLWAASNHSDEVGKFVQDGKFDEKAVSKQIGVAVLLKALR